MNEQEILGLEDKRFAAMIARDFAALDKLVHEQLLYTHSSGVTDTKQSWIESMQSGKVKYKSVKCSERKARFFGEVALLTGKAAIEANYRRMFASMVEIELEPLDRFATRERVVDDMMVRFRLVGDGMVNAPVAPGTRVELRLVHVFHMRDGRIAREIVHEDWRVLG